MRVVNLQDSRAPQKHFSWLTVLHQRLLSASMATRSQKSLVLIGSGPGIGQSVAALFASKRYDTVVLVARRQEQLDIDRKAVETAAPGVSVYTYVTDVADGVELKKTLEKISSETKTPETVFFNAAII